VTVVPVGRVGDAVVDVEIRTLPTERSSPCVSLDLPQSRSKLTALEARSLAAILVVAANAIERAVP
jgi:hypothetical protein